MNITFQRDAWKRLLIVLPGSDSPVAVEPVRCFPLTHPEEHISLVDDDGHEVLRVASLNDLTGEQRQLLLEELAAREFSPVIQRILRSGSSPPCSWDVVTDRGPCRLEINSEDDLRRLPDRSVVVIDTNGIRYRIPQTDQLDSHSRNILRRFL